MPDPLERCLAFLDRIDRRCAERTESWRYGTALFHDSLPRVWSLNLLLAEEGAGAEAGELTAAADRAQGAAGLDHRRIAIADDQLGARLAPAFRVLGWKAEALLVMPHVEAGKERAPARATEVAREQLEPAWAEGIRGSPYGRDEETVRQLVDQRRVIGEAGGARYFACLVDGRLVSYCDLYSDGKTAQIEGVMTHEKFRGKGLAGAVVTKALLESRAAGHDLTFLLALDEDWPKELYRKLGFAAAGRIWDFTKEPPVP